MSSMMQIPEPSDIDHAAEADERGWQRYGRRRQDPRRRRASAL
jgi:hypothetical protein